MVVKKILKNSLGATLLESVIVAAIVGINVLGVMYMESSLSKERSRQKVFDQVSSASRMIKAVIKNRAVCTLTIRDNPIDQAFNQLSNGTIDPNDLNNFIPINEQLIPADLGEEVTIRDYRIIIDAGKYYLETTFLVGQGAGAKAVGFDEITRRFFLNVKLDPVTNNFEECISEEKNQLESVAHIACTGIVGPDSHVDANTGACKPNTVLDPPSSEPKDCGPGASYKIVRVGNQFELDCKPCVPESKFEKWRCEKGKFKGVNWVNVCYYRTVGCKGSVDGLNQSEDDMFFMQGPTKAKGGDTGRRKSCEKKRRPCPGEIVAPVDAEKIAEENLMFANLHYETLNRKYKEIIADESKTGKRNDILRADLLNIWSDIEFAAEGVFRAQKADSNNYKIKRAVDEVKKIKSNAESIKNKVFK